ncbi:MAG: tetratricopeptide repeat protein [Chloroflexi bacterium]|nr:tetratricopeptide repeat protein [Chloroflexota bacterium]
MLTRLSNFCDKLLEAGWLAALIVAPIYFDIYSSRVFEPDKAGLVRSLALIMVAAWVIKRVETGFLRAPLRASILEWTRENPLLLPTLAVVIVYLISTLFSVAPSVSFWGSYQRLQGAYSMFSYIVIFLMTVTSLRTRAQLDRALNVVVLTSFPVAFYGLLQHFEMDPLPWGGDTTVRIAANMGNSIFVAAYLIMAVPLALARWMQSLARVSADTLPRVPIVAAAALALAALMTLWLFNFMAGTIFAIALLVVALIVAWLTRTPLRDWLVLASFTLILAAQAVAIFFSQSRGPWLGLAGGLFAFIVIYALARGARKVMLGAIGMAILAVAFLVLFNLPNTPLAPLKQVPYLGRLGQVFDAEPGSTGRVRELIWEGALQLVVPHAPLWSPLSGDDAINVIRPLVGYGPEAMYVAFNPFYPPELGRTEARNASPDRSHNETFDALVTTGLLGFGAYILLFISVFYFGLKWLGFIQSSDQRNAFVALWLIGGSLAALVVGAWRGWNYIGVALPAGMVVGLLVFLVLDALRARDFARIEGERALLLSALLAALIAHFFEIHFGIAIVATRTYFWFYAALLVLIGMNRLSDETRPSPAPESARVEPEESPKDARRRKRRSTARPVEPARREAEMSPAPVLGWTAAATLVMLTLAFCFVTNQAGSPSAFGALERALLYKGTEQTFGVLLLFLLTWIILGIVGLSAEMPRSGVTRDAWTLSIALYAVLSFTAWVWYVLLQLRWLTQPGDQTEMFINALGLYYIAFLLAVGVLGFALAASARGEAVARFQPANMVATPLLILVVGGLIYTTNFAGVQADIYYKAGTNYDAAGAWDRSITAYQRAFDLQPTQDFYALFLGRAYLEGARAINDSAQRTSLLTASQRTLELARQMNPLNTDHSANLARLFRLTTTLTEAPAEKTARIQKSIGYYGDATRLSPNAAHLRNEWALTYMLANDLPKMREQLDISLSLDTTFAQTYLYWGEYYRITGDLNKAIDFYLQALARDVTALSDPTGAPLPDPFTVLARPEFMSRTVEAYRAVLAKSPNLAARLVLAELYEGNGQLDRARQELEQAVQTAPNEINAHLALVNFLSQNGQIEPAVKAMQRMMELYAPSNPDYARLQEFLRQLQNLQTAIQNAQKAPNDPKPHRDLAAMWRARGQPQFAVPEYAIVARLAPTEYDAQKNLALLNLQLGKMDDAQSALVAAVALAPENEKSFWQNAQAVLNAHKARQFDEAMRAAQAAVALAPENDRPALQAYIQLLKDQAKK